MPKVTFVCEHREVEVKQGRLLSDVAAELGIEVCREEFAGTGIGDYTVWVKGSSGCVSPPTWYERVIKRCKGQRRMANRTKVLGDIEVWTQQGMGSRAHTPRPLSPAPRAGEDGSAMFDHENDPAGTAWNVYGHPYAVGTGKREPPKYEPKKKKAKKAPAKKAAPKAEPKAEAKPDAAKPDAAKPDAAKPDAKADAAKPDAAKPEAAKPDAKADEAKAEAAKPDAKAAAAPDADEANDE